MRHEDRAVPDRPSPFAPSEPTADDDVFTHAYGLPEPLLGPGGAPEASGVLFGGLFDGGLMRNGVPWRPHEPELRSPSAKLLPHTVSAAVPGGPSLPARQGADKARPVLNEAGLGVHLPGVDPRLPGFDVGVVPAFGVDRRYDNLQTRTEASDRESNARAAVRAADKPYSPVSKLLGGPNPPSQSEAHGQEVANQCTSRARDQIESQGKLPADAPTLVPRVESAPRKPPRDEKEVRGPLDWLWDGFQDLRKDQNGR